MSMKLKQGYGRKKSREVVFKACPQCDSPNLEQVGEDVVCTYCAWNSMEAKFEASLGRNFGGSLSTRTAASRAAMDQEAEASEESQWEANHHEPIFA